MVWGMTTNFGLGEFWPDGDFEYDKKLDECGWYARLSAYYAQQTPQEQKRLFDFKGDSGSAPHFYGTFPHYKFNNEPGALEKGALLGPLEPHEIPHFWDTSKSHKALGSLIKLSGKTLAVDEALKAIIERLEPGVHEFFEIPIRMPRGKLYPARYYVLRVGQYFDAISIKDTASDVLREVEAYHDPESGKLVTPAYITHSALRGNTKGIAVRRSVFGGAHLWRDRFFQNNLTCFSDELIGEISDAGLRIPKHYKMKEV